MRDLIYNFFSNPKFGSSVVENERALQLEMGIMFRNQGYEVKFEAAQNVPPHPRSTKRQKSNLDLLVKGNDEPIAIEFKVPLAGRVPETMYDFCADVSFIEAIVASGDAAKGYSIMMTNDKSYWTGSIQTGIYAPFRQLSYSLGGRIEKPTGTAKTELFLNGKYDLRWRDVQNTSLMQNAKFVIAECGFAAAQ